MITKIALDDPDTLPTVDSSEVKPTTTTKSPTIHNSDVQAMQQEMINFYAEAKRLEQNQTAMIFLSSTSDFQTIIEAIKNIGSKKAIDQVDGIWGPATSKGLISLFNTLNKILNTQANLNFNLGKTINDFPTLNKAVEFAQKYPTQLAPALITRFAPDITNEIKTAILTLIEFGKKAAQFAGTYQNKKLKGNPTQYQGGAPSEKVFEKIKGQSMAGWINNPENIINGLRGQGYYFKDRNSLMKLSPAMLQNAAAFNQYLTDQEVAFHGKPIAQSPVAIDYLLAVIQNNLLGGA